MNSARISSAVTQLSATLATDFDLPALLAAIAHHALRGHDASWAAIVLLDHRHGSADRALHVVAEAPIDGRTADLNLLIDGPALFSASQGVVTMIDDLDDADDTRWPEYRRCALAAGVRGVRAFPVVSLEVPLGSIVVHTAEPWGSSRSSSFGQTLANLTAVGLSSATGNRRGADTSDSIEKLLRGVTTVASATGILAEVLGLDVDEAQRELGRLARANGVTMSAYGRIIVEAHDRDPWDGTPAWSRQPYMPRPPHING
jgi:hypothetical protein